jgi:creatinine amidohydrolase
MVSLQGIVQQIGYAKCGDKTMRIEDCNWFDVENYLKSDDRLIFVLGACEQHGYLSLQTDTKVPLALADAASEQTGVLIAPSLNFGCSSYFLSYPGTLSLRTSTLLKIAEDLVRSAYQNGFRRLLFLNGHGGNNPATGRLYELGNEYQDLRMSWYSWWEANSVEQIAQKYQLKPRHGNWLEAFPFTRVCELPTGSKTPPVETGLMNAADTRKLFGDGAFGNEYQVDDSIYREILQVCLDDVLMMLQFE